MQDHLQVKLGIGGWEDGPHDPSRGEPVHFRESVLDELREIKRRLNRIEMQM